MVDGSRDGDDVGPGRDEEEEEEELDVEVMGTNRACDLRISMYSQSPSSDFQREWPLGAKFSEWWSKGIEDGADGEGALEELEKESPKREATSELPFNNVGQESEEDSKEHVERPSPSNKSKSK